MTVRQLVVPLVIVAPLAWFFGRPVVSGEVFAFRDAANYYYPLFQWECQQWKSGSVPLWNPQDNGGVPILADASSSVLYPGKLVFAVPCDFGRRFNLYLLLHALLAAAGSYGLARGWGISPQGAGLCALGYAFGGSVLFQYTNVIFLVGAAWLPLALLCAERMLVRRSPRHAVAMGATLALMTLGGDPQAAYHAVLLTALYGWLLWRKEARRRAGKPTHRPTSETAAAIPPSSGTGQAGRLRCALFLLALATGLVLSAVQVLPSWEWTKASDRAAYSAPRSLYEIAGYAMRTRRASTGNQERQPPISDRDAAVGRLRAAWQGLFGRPQAGTHEEHIYDFSLGPWRLIELVWPNITGRMFPTHRRWIAVFPAEGRVWTPTLYLGLLPLLLGLGSWRVRRASLRIRWLSWLAMLALWGSFGRYGLGWLLHELRVGLAGADPTDVLVGQPVGGLYWLMVLLLPGYVLFRYPAKLLVVASLGVSLLAGAGWDRAHPRLLRQWLAWIGGLSLGAALVAAVLRPLWDQWVVAPPASRFFGPLDVPGAASDVCRALAHAGVLSLALCCLVAWSARRGAAVGAQGRPRPRLPSACLVLTALDLMLAHAWLTPTVPRRLLDEVSAVEREIAHSASAADACRVFRASPRGWQPESWSQTISASRLAQIVRWERGSLFPKYHLLAHTSLVESYSTLASQEFRTLLEVAREHGWRRPDGVVEPHPAILNALSARFLLVPASRPRAPSATPARGRPEIPREAPAGGARNVPERDVRSRPAGTVPPEPPGGLLPAGDLEGVVLLSNPDALPKVWIVHCTETLPELRTKEPERVRRRTREALFPGGRPLDFRSMAVVEGAEVALRFSDPGGEDEFCRLAHYGAQRVEIDALLAAPGLVVLNDLFYPGWTAVAESGRGWQRVPLLRANRVMRGIPLPPGRHRVVLRYRPWSVCVGLALSAAGWSALVGMGAWRLCRRLPRGTLSGLYHLLRGMSPVILLRAGDQERGMAFRR